MDNIIHDMLTRDYYSDKYNWLYTEKSPYLFQHKNNPIQDELYLGLMLYQMLLSHGFYSHIQALEYLSQVPW